MCQRIDTILDMPGVRLTSYESSRDCQVMLSLNGSVVESVGAFTSLLPQAHNSGSFLPLLAAAPPQSHAKGAFPILDPCDNACNQDTTFTTSAVHTAHHCNTSYQGHVMRLQPMVHAQDTSATQLELD